MMHNDWRLLAWNAVALRWGTWLGPTGEAGQDQAVRSSDEHI
jgi:hypothetical protein